MNTYVFNMSGPTGTVEFYEDDLKSIIWEKDEDGCWVSYDPIPCVKEPEDPEVYVYDFRVCGNDLVVGGAYVKSIYSTNGGRKRIEDWKKLLEVPEDMEESRCSRGRMLSELFNKHYPDDDEIIFVVGPYVYDANGNTELDGYDSCDAFTDYDSARKFAQYNLANKSEDDVYFPIFEVEREEWENGLEGCLTDDMIVGIATKDPLLMKGRRYGDFDYRYMPKSVTGSGEYSQRIQNWAHIDESRHPHGRMLKEARITIDLDENKIFAVKGYPDYPQNDNCAYDEILVQEYDGSRFNPGSGHNNKECVKYASFANRLVDEYDDEHDDIEEELEEYVCKGLNEEFGGNWIVSGINGSSQGDSYTIIYNTETTTDKQIEYFRNDFFGFGYDYTCYNGLGEYEVNVFVNDIDEDKTLSIIADACGVDEANVEIVDKKPDFDFIRKHEVKESFHRRGRMLRESIPPKKGIPWPFSS